MSIYATIFHIEDERQWIAELQESGVDAAVIRDGEPDPTDLDAPIIYQGSHVLPSHDDPRGGSVSLALIPPHITRDGRDDRTEGEGPWPFLRLDVSSHSTTNHGGCLATVVLTDQQVLRLRDALTKWLLQAEKGPRQPT